MKPFEYKAYSQYGASMGRRSDRELSGRVRLARVPLDQGGYDPGGAYWGAGTPLYCAWDDDGLAAYARGRSRQDAANQLATNFATGARWYRGFR